MRKNIKICPNNVWDKKINVLSNYCLNIHKYSYQYRGSQFLSVEFSMFQLCPGKSSKIAILYVEIHMLSICFSILMTYNYFLHSYIIKYIFLSKLFNFSFSASFPNLLKKFNCTFFLTLKNLNLTLLFYLFTIFIYLIPAFPPKKSAVLHL